MSAEEEDYFTKPGIYCLFLHQSVWIDQGNYGCDGVYQCPRCQVYFDYPTQQKAYPVYKK